jgi:hypothetical protein
MLASKAVVNGQQLVFTDQAEVHISGCYSWDNCVTWGSESPRELSEHERDSPEVNIWCMLNMIHRPLVV